MPNKPKLYFQVNAIDRKGQFHAKGSEVPADWPDREQLVASGGAADTAPEPDPEPELAGNPRPPIGDLSVVSPDASG